MTGNNPAKQYLKAVRTLLPMQRRAKRHVMDQLTMYVEEHLYAHPNAEYSDLEKQFGTPQEVSAMYVDSESTAELTQALNFRQRAWKLMLSTAAALVLLFALVAGYVIWHVQNASEGYVVITIPQGNQSVLDADAPPPDLNEILANAGTQPTKEGSAISYAQT